MIISNTYTYVHVATVYMLTIILITLFFSSIAIAKQNMHDDAETNDQYNNDNNDSNYHRTIIIWMNILTRTCTYCIA